MGREGAGMGPRMCAECRVHWAEVRCLHCGLLLCGLHGQMHEHPDVEPLLLVPDTFIREIDDLFP